MPDPYPDGPVARFFWAAALLALCVAIHAAGLAGLNRLFPALRTSVQGRVLRDIWLLVRLAWSLILLHVIEIALWSGFYLWKKCLPDLDTAFYFSAITYTTVGYGDVVLSDPWRNLSSVEALTGILMSGLSTGFFFMFLSRFFNDKRMQYP